MLSVWQQLACFTALRLSPSEMQGEITGIMPRRVLWSDLFILLQVAVGILLAAGLNGGTVSEGVGVGIIVMFCLFALGFAW